MSAERFARARPLESGVLACPVRGCGEPLAPRGQALACPRAHSFDVARSGYVNLLQPQDRRSLAAGDAPEEIDARARLLAAGFGRALDEELARVVTGLGLASGALAVELGAGSGERLAALSARCGLAGLGIELASHAAERAARRFPECAWVVANADRRLPLRDGSVALVLSVHGRRNPAECARVLAPGGFLVAALPAEDDLAELRAAVQGTSLARERVASFLAIHEGAFGLLQRTHASERRRAGLDELRDLLACTYRGARRSEAEAIAALEEAGELEVTLASDVLVLGRRAP